MNKKHNRLLDSSKIQQESLHKKRVKRDEASGNIGENMNSEFHKEKVVKEMEFNDEIPTMVVDGKEDELKFHDSLGVVEQSFEGSETDESLKNKQRRGGLFLIGITIVISLVMVFSFPVVEETKFWKTLWEKTPLKWVNHMLQLKLRPSVPVGSNNQITMAVPIKITHSTAFCPKVFVSMNLGPFVDIKILRLAKRQHKNETGQKGNKTNQGYS